jgi:hypothetical protein
MKFRTFRSYLIGLPHRPDGQHLTPERYRMLAESLATQVAGAIGRLRLLGGPMVARWGADRYG